MVFWDGIGNLWASFLQFVFADGAHAMSLPGTRRPANAHQFTVMFVAVALGFIGAPWYMVLIAAMLLVGAALFDDAEVQERVLYASAAVNAGSAVLALAAMSLGFAALCYVAGYAVSLLAFS